MKLSERGEEIEHTFFDQLVSMQGDILNDTVILQSVCFLTDVKKKKHQEFDLVIFSWSRKLVIGIEMKRQLTDTAFEQIYKYHALFEIFHAISLVLAGLFFQSSLLEKTPKCSKAYIMSASRLISNFGCQQYSIDFLNKTFKYHSYHQSTNYETF